MSKKNEKPAVSARVARKRFAIRLVLTGIILGGACLRLWWLDRAAFRADTILFWNICGNPALGVGDIIFRWWEVFGRTDHSPFPMAFVKLFLTVTQLTPSHFTVRLPMALMGIAAIPCMFLAGRRMLGAGFGLFCAAIMAVNPFHIQNSMEAYFYGMILPGSALLTWLTLDCFYFRRAKIYPLKKQVLFALALFLCMYSHFTAWFTAIPACLVVLGVALYRRFRRSAPMKELIRWFVSMGVIGLPLLFVPWTFRYIIENAKNSAEKANIQNIFGEYTGTVFTLVRDYFASSGWGTTPFRLTLGAVLVLTSLAVLLVAIFRRRWIYLLAPGLLLCSCVLLFAGSKVQGTPPNLRYLSAAYPAFFLFMGMGIWRLPYSLRRFLKFPAVPVRLAGRGIAIAMILPLVLPAWDAARLDGKPVPYKLIQRFVDTQLPAGTPVLVDRWFEPWNELKVYPCTNVFFTFTIPNEPLETFLQVDWRKTAEQFFEKYPDAAYLEIAKSYWENPQVGPWQWPREYFKQHAVIRNEAGLKLRNLGLLYREDGGIYTNRLIVEVFYNTTEDIITAARKQGRDVLRLYGEGWGYAKPGWQQGHFEDYRTFGQAASIDLYNLKETPLSGSLEISAATAERSKTVSVNGTTTAFASGRIKTWTIPLTLPPGRNPIPFASPSKDPLFVLDIRWKPMQ